MKPELLGSDPPEPRSIPEIAREIDVRTKALALQLAGRYDEAAVMLQAAGLESRRSKP